MRKVSPVIWITAALAIAILALTGFYLSRPAPKAGYAPPSSEASAYLSNLRLSDVSMKAAENLMHQQVVYIDGKIANTGPRNILKIEVYCLFSGIDGQELYRERVPVVQAPASAPFASGQTRSFELPFDTLPEGWNQGMPRLVVAQIQFAQ